MYCNLMIPECVAKGSRLTLEVMEVEVVFAQRCFHDRNRPQPSAGVRNEGAKPHHWAALTKCDKM